MEGGKCKDATEPDLDVVENPPLLNQSYPVVRHCTRRRRNTQGSNHQEQAQSEQDHQASSNRLACLLNNAGASLHSSGDHDGAMECYREAVQTRVSSLPPAQQQLNSKRKRTTKSKPEWNEETLLKKCSEIQMRCQHQMGSTGLSLAMEDARNRGLDLLPMSGHGSDSDGCSRGVLSLRFSAPCTLDDSRIDEAESGDKISDSAVTLYNMALLHHQDGDLDTARSLFLMVLKLFDGQEQETQTSSSTECDAASPSTLGDVKECLSRDIDKTLLAAAIFNNLGQMHSRVGEKEEAVLAFHRALEIERCRCAPSHRARHTETVAATLSGIGRVLYDRGELDQALAVFIDRLQLLRNGASSFSSEGGTGSTINESGRNVEADVHVAAALYDVGIVHHARGDKDLALECCARLVSHPIVSSPSFGNDFGVASALHAVGTMLYESGTDLEDARELLVRSLEMKRSLQTEKGGGGRNDDEEGGHVVVISEASLAATLHRLAQVYHRTGQYPEALGLFRETLFLIKGIMFPSTRNSGCVGVVGTTDDRFRKHVHTVINILCSIGQIRHRMGDVECSIQAYTESLRLARDLDTPNGSAVVAWILVAMGRIYLERHQVDHAVALFSEAHGLYEASKDTNDFDLLVLLSILRSSKGGGSGAAAA